ncbi:hypothetical protein [Xanthomonas oryzae]|uniref:hypothetical protein n=1 Tax=Xanthomonas oryzae TaxID=347 RepID=UPI002DE5C45C|nr:hypothetical protein [Xanthomonas oryzae pv. oryzicola]MEC5113825.1 hypothetical protein [Xanthomonas oryzae pv. oryzicola]
MKKNENAELVLSSSEKLWVEKVAVPLHEMVAKGGRPVLSREESESKVILQLKEILGRRPSLKP